MRFSSVPDDSFPLLIQLELQAEQADEADLAFVAAVGRETVHELQTAGYRVQPASSGQRGGILVDVVTTLTTLATDAWTHKEMIEHALTDANELVAVCGGVATVVKTLQSVLKKRTAGTTSAPVKISIEIDGAPLSVEAADLEQAEAALKLAQKLYASHPEVAKKVTPQSKIKVNAQVPHTPRRKRR